MIEPTVQYRLGLLYDLESGNKVVLPVSEEHARFMIQVGEFYLNQHHEHTMKLLKEEHGN